MQLVLKLNSLYLTNSVFLDVNSQTYVSFDKLAQQTIERERSRTSSFELTQEENQRLFFTALAELKFDEYDEDFLAPTRFAYETASEYLNKLSKSFNRALPIPVFVSDGEGGIRATWEVLGKTLRLVCPANAQRKSYIYFEQGDNYDIEKDIKPNGLIRRFHWLLN